MQYSVSSEVLEINLVTIFMASLFAALVCVPSMTIFAAAFNPQIMVNFIKVVRTCPVNAWRNRKAILYGLFCCPCKAWSHAVQLVNARAALTTVRARWRKARRRLKLFAGMATDMAAPAPHQMERDCECTSTPAAPAKNTTSIIKVPSLPSLSFVSSPCPVSSFLSCPGPAFASPSVLAAFESRKPTALCRSTGRPSRRSAKNNCSRSIAKRTWRETRVSTVPLGYAREGLSTLRSTSTCSCSRSRARCAHYVVDIPTPSHACALANPGFLTAVLSYAYAAGAKTRVAPRRPHRAGLVAQPLRLCGDALRLRCVRLRRP